MKEKEKKTQVEKKKSLKPRTRRFQPYQVTDLLENAKSNQQQIVAQKNYQLTPGQQRNYQNQAEKYYNPKPKKPKYFSLQQPRASYF